MFIRVSEISAGHVVGLLCTHKDGHRAYTCVSGTSCTWWRHKTPSLAEFLLLGRTKRYARGSSLQNTSGKANDTMKHNIVETPLMSERKMQHRVGVACILNLRMAERRIMRIIVNDCLYSEVGIHVIAEPGPHVYDIIREGLYL